MIKDPQKLVVTAPFTSFAYWIVTGSGGWQCLYGHSGLTWMVGLSAERAKEEIVSRKLTCAFRNLNASERIALNEYMEKKGMLPVQVQSTATRGPVALPTTSEQNDFPPTPHLVRQEAAYPAGRAASEVSVDGSGVGVVTGHLVGRVPDVTSKIPAFESPAVIMGEASSGSTELPSPVFQPLVVAEEGITEDIASAVEQPEETSTRTCSAQDVTTRVAEFESPSVIMGEVSSDSTELPSPVFQPLVVAKEPSAVDVSSAVEPKLTSTVPAKISTELSPAAVVVNDVSPETPGVMDVPIVEPMLEAAAAVKESSLALDTTTAAYGVIATDSLKADDVTEVEPVAQIAATKVLPAVALFVQSAPVPDSSQAASCADVINTAQSVNSPTAVMAAAADGVLKRVAEVTEIRPFLQPSIKTKVTPNRFQDLGGLALPKLIEIRLEMDALVDAGELDPPKCQCCCKQSKFVSKTCAPLGYKIYVCDVHLALPIPFSKKKPWDPEWMPIITHVRQVAS